MDNITDVYPNGTTNETYEGTSPTMEQILVIVRDFKIQELYGDHFYANFVATFVISILGYITNLLNVIVLSQTPLANSMNLFLMVLSISDIFQITTQITHVVHYFNGFKLYPYYDWYVFYVLNTYFENSFVFISNWLVVVIGIWRLMAIAWPLDSRRLCSRFRAKLTIFLIFILSFGISAMIFPQFTYQREEFAGSVFYDTAFSEFALKDDELYLKIQWGVQLLKGLLPMVLLVFSTLGLVGVLFWTTYQRHKVLKMETPTAVSHKITVMLLVLMVLYWLSNLPDGFMFLIKIINSQDDELQKRYRSATDLIRVFSMVNTSVSFFIYYALGEDFRRKFNKMFCRPVYNHFERYQTSEGLSESSTVRSKSFDVGQPRKGSTVQMHALHL